MTKDQFEFSAKMYKQGSIDLNGLMNDVELFVKARIATSKCSTLREIIEQNLNNVISHDKYNITPEMELVSKTKQSTYRYLLKIIDELQPVA